MALALPAPDVVTPDGVDVRGVQSNFEAVALAMPGKSTSVPSGTVLPFGGTTAPVGYLLCDGASYSATQYVALFNAIRYRFGGSGASFNVPALTGGTINSVVLSFVIKI